jgi:hypothetical protein
VRLRDKEGTGAAGIGQLSAALPKSSLALSASQPPFCRVQLRFPRLFGVAVFAAASALAFYSPIKRTSPLSFRELWLANIASSPLGLHGG